MPDALGAITQRDERRRHQLQILGGPLSALTEPVDVGDGLPNPIAFAVTRTSR
jgi:hypothetical protein